MTRHPAIQAFLTSAGDALRAASLASEGSAAIAKIYGALASPAQRGPERAQRRAVCDAWLPEALGNARRGSPELIRVADALEAVEPELTWGPRSASGPNASDNWPDGHANAMIVGPGGLEPRSDVQIGVSLLAPHVRYPDHNHAPEEVYLVLSRGRFQHGGSGWFEPGLGGTLYNEPNIQHAMASDSDPLLALWFLWVRR